MDSDGVWRTIDAERLGLADLLEDLSPAELATPSLCSAWRVHDVAAHLSLAHMGATTALAGLARAHGSFDGMIRDTALRQAALPLPELTRRLRAMAGSRRTAVGVTELEPLLDLLVHGQDIAVPLGRSRPVPPEAGAVAATRVWTMGWPFHARRRLRGLRLVAVDAPWSAGEGALVEGPIAALLLLLTGRRAGREQLFGEGTDLLAAAR